MMAARRTLLVVGEGLKLSFRPGLAYQAAAPACAHFSTSSRQDARHHRLVIIGGGTAGAAVANKFGPSLGKEQVCIVEPSETHYYQPLWTLVGAGLKHFDQSAQREEDILPKQCTWLKDRAKSFDPDNNTLTTYGGETITYDYLVVTTGITLDYYKIEGCLEAMENDPFVCSNYSPKYVHKTWWSLRNLEKGNAIFTFPNGTVKCAGAPQKACYLAEDYFRRSGKRDKINVMYNTALPVIFGIPRYAESLRGIVADRNITVNHRHNLVKVDYKKKIATFALLDSEKGETVDFEYGMLHVAPPMATPKELWNSALVDDNKFVSVNRETLRHNKFGNVFAMGDCASLPTAKTAAAIASQIAILAKNLRQVMKGTEPSKKYDGYTSCPLMITKHTCIMAEFGYDGTILETFPINQSKPRASMAYMKKIIMPPLYFKGLVKGIWHGPEPFRKLLRLGVKTANCNPVSNK